MKYTRLFLVLFLLLTTQTLFSAEDNLQVVASMTDSLRIETSVQDSLSAVKSISIQEVVVEGERRSQSSAAFVGREILTSEDMRAVPVLLGEADVLQAVRLLSGVKSVSEGNSGIYVRGGGAGQNYFMLDGMELLNPSHLMGLYSVFNPLTTAGVEVYKGNAPVHLQGRLSSTIEVVSVRPDSINQGLECNLGNLSASVAFSHVSKDGNWDILLGYRRSYLEALGLLGSAFLPEDRNYFKDNVYSFYDYNGSIHGRLSSKSELSLAWYTGKDRFRFNDYDMRYNAASDWGNRSILLNYLYVADEANTFQTSLGFSSTFSGFDGQLIENDMIFLSSYEQFQWKNQWDHRMGNLLIKTGVDFFEQNSIPIDMVSSYMTDTVNRYQQFRNVGFSAYTGGLYRTHSGRLMVYAGIRSTVNATLGPYTYNTETVATNDFVHAWVTCSPVVSISYFPKAGRSVKASYSMNDQNLHLASLSSVPLPMDIWVSSSPRLRPETANQLSVGYYTWTPFLDISIEAYGKYMKQLLIFNVITDNPYQHNFEDLFFRGKGVAFGIDCSLRKKTGAFTGSLNYSFSKSLRSYSQIMEGAWFNDKNDRPHDLTLNLNYTVSPAWDFILLWSFASGSSMTLPSGRSWMMGMVMNDYDNYNGFRFPPYHRLDISANWHLKSRNLRESVLNFSIINVYNRANPYYAYFKVYMDENAYSLDIKSYQMSLFPILPSISWRFKI